MKKILITGGPTWVKIDAVRIITNIFSGQTALYLAKEFRNKGFYVSLFLNPHVCKKRIKGINFIYFRYYDEFKKKIIEELKKNQYDLIIHSAAVSDFRPKKVFKEKISSKNKKWILELVPTQKIIRWIRKLSSQAIIVQFKLELNTKGLIDKAYQSLKENKVDYVVANALKNLKKKYLIDKEKNVKTLNTKKDLFISLYKILINTKSK
jgi:phosphopantothenoylcysteine decarboxylase/phosphopantothenate--cysteine ligase